MYLLAHACCADTRHRHRTFDVFFTIGKGRSLRARKVLLPLRLVLSHSFFAFIASLFGGVEINGYGTSDNDSIGTKSTYEHWQALL